MVEIIKQTLHSVEKYKDSEYVGMKDKKFKFKINKEIAMVSHNDSSDVLLLEFPDQTKKTLKINKEILATEVEVGMVLQNVQLDQTVEINCQDDVAVVKQNIEENSFKYTKIKDKNREILNAEVKKEETKEEIKKEEMPDTEKKKKISRIDPNPVDPNLVERSLKIYSKVKQGKAVVIYNSADDSFRTIPFNKEFKRMNSGVKKMQISRIEGNLSSTEVIVNKDIIFK